MLIKGHRRGAESVERSGRTVGVIDFSHEHAVEVGKQSAVRSRHRAGDDRCAESRDDNLVVAADVQSADSLDIDEI